MPVVRVTVVQLEMAVDAKPQKLEKKLITHVGVSEMVNMLDGRSLASRANALLPVDYLFSKVFPLSGIEVIVILIPPLRVFWLAGIHREAVNAYDWILGHGRKKVPEAAAS